MGRPRRGHPRAPGALEPRPDPAPPGHPGVRAQADRRQGHPAAPAGVRRLQRRLRRRPDGRARPVEPRGPVGSARPDDVDQQHPVARQRQADHRALAGHRARPLLPVAGQGRRAGRRQGVLRPRRHRSRPGSADRHPAHQDQGPLHRERRRGDHPHPRDRHHAGPDEDRGPAAASPGHRPPPDREAADQEGNRQPDRRRLSPLRSEGDGDLRRPDHGAGLQGSGQGRHLLRQG